VTVGQIETSAAELAEFCRRNSYPKAGIDPYFIRSYTVACSPFPHRIAD
jgi:hypothetical protein